MELKRTVMMSDWDWMELLEKEVEKLEIKVKKLEEEIQFIHEDAAGASI